MVKGYYLWDSLKLEREYKWPKSFVSLAISSDKELLIAASGDGTLKVGDLNEGHELYTIKKLQKSLYCVAISPDSKIVVTGGAYSIIKAWDLESKQEIYTCNRPSPIYSLAVDPNGLFIVAGRYGYVDILNVQTGDIIDVLEGHSDIVCSVRVSDCSNFIITGSYDSTIRIWDFWKQKEVVTLVGPGSCATGIDFNFKKNIVVSGDEYGIITIWNLSSGERSGTLQGHLDSIESLLISPDGRMLISSSYDRSIVLWNLQNCSQHKTLIKGTERAGTVRFTASHGSNVIVTGNNIKRTIQVWRASAKT